MSISGPSKRRVLNLDRYRQVLIYQISKSILFCYPIMFQGSGNFFIMPIKILVLFQMSCVFTCKTWVSNVCMVFLLREEVQANLLITKSIRSQSIKGQTKTSFLRTDISIFRNNDSSQPST